MSRIVQAYFESENQAQSAKIKTEAYGAKLLDIGPLESPPSKKVVLLAPYAGGSSMPSGAASTAASGAMNGTSGVISPALGATAVKERKSGTLRHMLSLRVQDDDYEQVVDILRQNNGHVEKID